MPAKPSKPASPFYGTLSQELRENLSEVVRLVQAKAREAGEGEASSLALLRVLRGITAADWEVFASTHGLEDWLSIPLGQELTSAVEQMLSLQSRLAFQRDHDALTGIGNRGYFNYRLDAEVERAIRSRTELSLLYIDLDDFKRINDSYGHGCGDMVLQRLANVLQSLSRHYDIVARIGGEEFAVLLPAASCWAGVLLGNRVLESFRKEQFHCNGVAFTMTFSGGVSSLALLPGEEKSGTQLLKSADTALYDAKREGKNTIVLAKSDKFAKEQECLVQAHEKQLLFGPLSSEYDQHDQ